MPSVPFSWCGCSPAVNRILGIDMVKVTKKFYSLLYHANVTDEQAREILGNSYNG